MNKSTVGLIFFAAGSVAGYMIAQKLLRDKYEQLVQDEVDSIKKSFCKYGPKEAQPVTAESTNAPSKACDGEKVNYRKFGESLKYIQKSEETQVALLPRIISPDEFGEQDGYDEISLTYYADRTLTDDHDHPLDDDEIEETVGKDSLLHFGEYEPDSVFVRNDRLKTDYEILLDTRTYAQVLVEKPWLAH